MFRCEACDTGVYCGFCVASPMTGFFVSVRSNTTSRRRKSTSPAPEGERCAALRKFPDVSGSFPGRTFPLHRSENAAPAAPQRMPRQQDGVSRGKTQRCVAWQSVARPTDSSTAAPRSTRPRNDLPAPHSSTGRAAQRPFAGWLRTAFLRATCAHALRRAARVPWPTRSAHQE